MKEIINYFLSLGVIFLRVLLLQLFYNWFFVTIFTELPILTFTQVFLISFSIDIIYTCFTKINEIQKNEKIVERQKSYKQITIILIVILCGFIINWIQQL